MTEKPLQKRNRYDRALQPPSMRFQSRDGHILEYIFKYGGIVARRHIREEFWPTAKEQAMDKCLSRLFHNGYLDWPSMAQRRERPIPEPVIWLGWKGILYVAGLQEVIVKEPANDGENQMRKLEIELRRQRIRWLREPRWSQLFHDLRVVDFRLAVERSIFRMRFERALDRSLPEISKFEEWLLRYTLTHLHRAFDIDKLTKVINESRERNGQQPVDRTPIERAGEHLIKGLKLVAQSERGSKAPRLKCDFVEPPLKLQEWTLESDLRADMTVVEYTVPGEGGKQKKVSRGVVPDGYFLITDEERRKKKSGFKRRHLLEIDNASHSNPKWGRDKAIPYLAYVRESKEFEERYGKNMAMWLVVTTGPRRMEHLMKQTGEAVGKKAWYFLFTTWNLIVESDNILTGAIWHKVGKPEGDLVALFPT